jgi:hypothetical protein
LSKYLIALILIVLGTLLTVTAVRKLSDIPRPSEGGLKAYFFEAKKRNPTFARMWLIGQLARLVGALFLAVAIFSNSF